MKVGRDWQSDQKHARVSAQFLFRVYRACLAIGARQPVLLQALDLREADLRDPMGQFDAAAISMLCRASSRELAGEDVTLDIGQHLVPTGFSDGGYAAFFERSIGDVLRASLAALEVSGGEKLCSLERDKISHRLVWNGNASYSNELVQIAFSTLIAIGELTVGGQFPAVKAIYFTHPKPDGFGDHLEVETLRAPIPCHFGQSATYLEYHPQLIISQNPFYNQLVRTICQHEDCAELGASNETSLPRLIYRYLLPLLDKNGLSLDCAAETFGIAERSLRRKLVTENTSFRQILEQVRRDVCHLYFLEGTRSLSEIATKLGYSELSAFTRAYTAWYGHPPSRDMRADIAMAV